MIYSYSSTCSWRIFAASTILLSLGLTVSQAAEIQTEFRVGAGYTNNINRDPDITLDETVGRLGVTFNFISDQRLFDVEVQSDLDYNYYEGDTFDSETIGGINALATLTLVRDRLIWNAINNYGQQLVDPLVAPTPRNRENVNFLTTGPKLILPVGRRNQLGIEALYSWLTYELRPLDNERQEGRLWFGREIRRDVILSLNARAITTEFDDQIQNTDFDINEAFLRLEHLTPNGESSLAFDLGISELEYGDADSEDEFLFRAMVEKSLSAYTSVWFLAGTGFTDPGQVFRFNQDNNFDGGITQNVDGNGIPFRKDYANLTVRYELERAAASTRLGWQKDEYGGRSARGRDVLDASVSAIWNLSRSLFVDIRLDYGQLDYSDVDRRDHIFFGRLGIGYRFSPTLNATIHYGYFSRSSNSATAEFDEDRVFLMFNYAPRWDTQS